MKRLTRLSFSCNLFLKNNFLDCFGIYYFVLSENLDKTIKIIITESEQLLAIPQSFLPINSEIQPEQEMRQVKRKKYKLQQGGNSFIYHELKKIEDADPDKKRQCLIKYLKQQGQMKDTSKIIEIIQQEGHAIPIMQVAIALSRYDKNFLKQLLDTKTIEEKQQKQEEIYELNQKMQSDPILNLLSQSEQLKKSAKQQKQPSFLDFKLISPKKIDQLIDIEKGKLKKSKSKLHSMIQYPKQLKDLKKELYSLPYINRYRKQLALKKEIKRRTIEADSHVVKSLVDLNSQTKQLRSISKHEKQDSLENKLKQALQKRSKLVDVSMKEIALPKITKINSDIISSPKDKQNKQNKNVYETITRDDNNFDKTFKNSQNTCSINPEQRQPESRNKQTSKSIDYRERSFWPSYQRFSPHRKRYRTEIEKLQQKVRSLTELSDIPSQSTMNMYTSLKNMQNNDLKKLQKQSFQQQRAFSNTKYRIKYKNLKESYSKRLKQFTKERKIRQFEIQQDALQQKSNYAMKTVKFNDKMLEKMNLTNN